jgi:DNA-nicking Smr family endonuclease
VNLKDLGALRQALQQREKAAAEAAAAARAAQAAAEARKRLFAEAVGPVVPLPPANLAELHLPRPEPLPHQREADEVDIESLLLTDDGLSFRRPGVGPDVVTRLRRGQWAIQHQIDLHGLRRDEAREALLDFLHEARRRGQRCVRVVHGKGHGSPGKQPVLKGKVQRWLAQSAEVLAFAQASGPQGGAGALVVLLTGD